MTQPKHVQHPKMRFRVYKPSGQPSTVSLDHIDYTKLMRSKCFQPLELSRFARSAYYRACLSGERNKSAVVRAALWAEVERRQEARRTGQG